MIIMCHTDVLPLIAVLMNIIVESVACFFLNVGVGIIMA